VNERREHFRYSQGTSWSSAGHWHLIRSRIGHSWPKLQCTVGYWMRKSLGKARFEAYMKSEWPLFTFFIPDPNQCTILILIHLEIPRMISKLICECHFLLEFFYRNDCVETVTQQLAHALSCVAHVDDTSLISIHFQFCPFSNIPIW